MQLAVASPKLFDEGELRRLLAALEHSTGRSFAAVGLKVVSKTEMTALNERYAGLREPTDVLSFPDETHQGGDIVICRELARAQAAAAGWSLREELLLLTAHAALHLLGYDHQSGEDRAQMTVFEREALTVVGLTAREYR